ncbi:hypothetical protein [Streptomyces sp. NPDC005970]|uniref:hypothetical protein n=1 Tax=Streptomyces sp. NPDC005970 TaxID=3156723 RepID=UPI0033C17C14
MSEADGRGEREGHCTWGDLSPGAIYRSSDGWREVLDVIKEYETARTLLLRNCATGREYGSTRQNADPIDLN